MAHNYEGAGAVAAVPGCSRALLEQASDRYTAAQSTGQVQWLDHLLAPGAVLLENEQPLAPRASRLGRPLRIDRSHTIYDLTQCAVFVETIASDPADPWVIGAQIRLGATNRTADTSTAGRNATGSAEPLIVKIDRIVTTTGDWLFNATRTLHYALLEDWAPIQPASRRDNRTTLKAAADAYFGMLANHSRPVPWGHPCTRLEGGSYTGRGLANDTCDVGIPTNSTMQAPNRRYVIDETVGAVSMLLEFGGINNAPDSHEFRILDGRLRRVHTMTFCAEKPNCGVQWPEEPDPGY
ncbi:hypothetical protein SPI_06520 [Niveomyces insectorum RCEF 264]|uniref:DUF8021 domain-containing protein n=1 Tax=Niveomyces insectorum RCEF 264 TaxID=1081102 RepID=A0A167RBQ7_9HYPO|nr:hypothetical protein SPI_06520 [Niveomyces insectorum RCEF 264]